MRAKGAYLVLAALLAGAGVYLAGRVLGEVLRDLSDIPVTGLLRATSQFGSARRGGEHGDPS
jgi:hypothetical protein